MSEPEHQEPPGGRNDHYASYIGELQTRTEVRATEDIYNQRGVRLIRSGTRIGKSESWKLLQHKLLKPLETQIEIGERLDAARLLADTDNLLARYADLAQVHERLMFAPQLERLATRVNVHPLWTQKLTVLRTQLPGVYEEALFCALLACYIATEMECGADAVCAAFLAGLAHDIGFLHLPPELVRKTGTLVEAEWRALQSHVPVGHLFLANLHGLDPEVPVAVLQHHERCDGTGYPAGRSAEGLSVIGQVIALADAVEAIRVNQFAAQGRNLRDLQPFLHLNDTTHFYEVYQALFRVLKQSGLALTSCNPFGSIGAYAGFVAARSRILKEAVELLRALGAEAGRYADNARARSLRRVAEHVQKISIRSGLLREELLQWLQAVQQCGDQCALTELSEIELMQNELAWQLKNARRTFEGFVASVDRDDTQWKKWLQLGERFIGCEQSVATSH